MILDRERLSDKISMLTISRSYTVFSHTESIIITEIVLVIINAGMNMNERKYK